MAWSQWIRFVAVVGLVAGCGSDSSGGSGTESTGGSEASTGGSSSDSGSAGSGGSTEATAGATSSAATSGGSGGSGSGSTGAAPDGCTVNALEPGITRPRSSTSATGHALFDVHVPPSYDGSEPVPLLLNLHGFGRIRPSRRLLRG